MTHSVLYVCCGLLIATRESLTISMRYGEHAAARMHTVCVSTQDAVQLRYYSYTVCGLRV